MWLALCRIHVTSLINFALQALNRIGLRVVMDVVYNHLDSSGPCGISSVLDKVVTFENNIFINNYCSLNYIHWFSSNKVYNISWSC